jgi:hypothetical protein
VNAISPRIGHPRKRARRGHDTDDLVGPIVEPQRLTDDAGIGAKSPPPQTVAQDDDGDLARRVFFGDEPPAGRDPQAEERLKALRRAHDDEPFRLAAAGQVLVRGPERGHVREDVPRLTQIVEPGRRDGRPGQRRRIAVPDHGEPFGVGERQRREQHAADHREDRRVRADAQRQRQHRHQRKRRRPDQEAQRISDVPPHCAVQMRADRERLKCTCRGSNRHTVFRIGTPWL